MNEKEALNIANKDKVHLNYSPDTSLLLCLGTDENGHLQNSQPILQTASADPNIPDEIPQNPDQLKNLQNFDESWNCNMISNNIPFSLDPNSLNILNLSQDVVQSNIIYNPNFNQNQMQTMENNNMENFNQNMPFIQNFIPQMGMNQPSLDDCLNNSNIGGIPIIPINYPLPNFQNQFPVQRFPPEICPNIYVNKGGTKLSEAEDWTPNPHRLLDILIDLEKLNEIICKLKDECDLPNAKPNLKRERNRLASKFDKF